MSIAPAPWVACEPADGELRRLTRLEEGAQQVAGLENLSRYIEEAFVELEQAVFEPAIAEWKK